MGACCQSAELADASVSGTTSTKVHELVANTMLTGYRVHAAHAPTKHVLHETPNLPTESIQMAGCTDSTEN